MIVHGSVEGPVRKASRAPRAAGLQQAYSLDFAGIVRCGC